ncbi:MAG TPA: hypothetical protein PLX72_09125, partial [Candidatus Syntrophosphaera sp.]|nr:hypothetical protein [Candidatus Syntrophosphaera sp.]
PTLGNVLETSDYQNYRGLQLMQPDFGLPADVDFALSWGTRTINTANPGFRVEIQQFADPDSDADLLLPAPSYLEIEGTALGNNGGITRFKNPARSKLGAELLRLFYELGWISPATAEINHWNDAADQLLKTVSAAAPQAYDPALVEIANLRDVVLPLDNLLQQRVIMLYEKRKSPTGF